jgi:hypothetical protein
VDDHRVEQGSPRVASPPTTHDEGAQMGDSVEFRDGVFVATGPTEAVGHDPAGGAATATALMVRPDDRLAAVDAPGPLVSADLPPAGPTRSTSAPAPAGGGARRIAVATIVASLIAAVAFGAAAFGGAFGGGTGPAPGSGRSSLGAAAATSAAATSVAFAMSATRSTASSTTTLVTGSGAADLTHRTGRLTATVPGLAGYVGSGNDTVNVITDGTSIYLGSPAISSLTGGNSWLKADLPKDASSSDLSSLAVLSNPSQLIGLLSSVGGQVTTVGTVDLHGTKTTEYRTTVTLSELASRAGISSASTLGAQAAKILQQLGSTTVPITAWVDAGGYLRQISASVDLSRATIGGIASDLIGGALGGTLPTGTSGQATTATTVTVGFDHYNAPVAVVVPPASRTTDVSSIVSSVRGMVSDVRHAVSSIASEF